MQVKLTIPRVCRQCGTDFLAATGQVNRGGGVYCSRVCQWASQAAGPAEYIVSEDRQTASIPLLTGNSAITAYVLVDIADADWINQWGWSLFHGYACRQVRRTEDRPKHRYVHREILGLKPNDGLYGDHINRDRLDCRRVNLRAVTTAENSQNRAEFTGGASKYRGVYRGRSGRWTAGISIKGKSVYLGAFSSEEEAAEVARQARARIMPFSMN